MDHFSEPERLEVIDLTSDDEDSGYNNCPNGSSSISKMTSSGICHIFSSKAPANILAMQEINDTEAPGGTAGFRQCDENNLVHGCSVTHPRVNNSPFYLRLPSKNMKPPWANSYKMKSANMLSRPKQQIEQRPLQVDNSAVQFQHMDSPKLSSEEGHLLQCRQLKREAQVSSFLPYSHKRILIDNNASVPPQSEGILNGSLQMNGCPMPDQLPLLHHHKECRDPMGPVCRTARENLKRNSQGVTTSEIRLAMAGTPSIGTTENMTPPKRMKLENTSKDGTSDEGIKAERGDKSRNLVIVRQLEEENQVQIASSKGKMELESTIISTSSNGLMLGANSERPKMKGLSLVESFSKEEVREHIISLRHSDDLLGVRTLQLRRVALFNKEKEDARKERNHSTESSGDDTSCSLCGKNELYLEHPPKYCGSCFLKISPKGSFYYVIGNAYYTAYEGYTNTVFCVKCYKRKASAGQIMVGNVGISKTHLVITRDIDNVAEPWVECGRCEAWQHQICALFNDDLNKDDTSGNGYMCPSCLLQDMEDGVCMPVPQSIVLSAENLPKTKLSDHLEKWLFRSLEKDRRDRASSLGRNRDEVLGVQGLVVRVVSSVDKTLEVNKRFREIFWNEEYPAEFPYKSKAIFLFQKIDGADVCLFGMYVQEFGSECAVPNQRLVCISYLDSVKYFRPEIKAANREALRTFVYHNILIGYLDYCKKRGFMSCYIWSCPPINKDDYILYCHPTTQKLPMRQSLRRWYRKLVQRAQTETVVVEHTNLYDRYFKPPSYCTAKVTASRLPYFDGDWWLGETENFFKEYVCHKEEAMTGIDCGVRKAKRQQLSRDMEDSLLMDYLAKKIGSIKKDFIMVHFQHTCQHCSQPIVSGTRWVTKENLNLCDECYSVEQENREKSKKKRVYYKEVKVESVPTDTNDEDQNLHSEYVDTRFMLLNLCQRKNYQFDTLRRAKHSTMMILYHLHEEQKKQRRQQLWKKLLDLLVHTSECPAPRCTYGGCCLLKHLSHHVKICETRAKNGCTQCMKMWQILKVHARNCKESECRLPRCRDLKENMAQENR